MKISSETSKWIKDAIQAINANNQIVNVVFVTLCKENKLDPSQYQYNESYTEIIKKPIKETVKK